MRTRTMQGISARSTKVTAAALGVALAAGTALGCTGPSYRFADVDLDSSQYEVLGEGEAEATGVMLFNIIPIGNNDKIERAIESLRREWNGDEVVDVTVQESWFWAYVLNGYSVEVSGTVVQETSEARAGAERD